MGPLVLRWKGEPNHKDWRAYRQWETGMDLGPDP